MTIGYFEDDYYAPLAAPPLPSAAAVRATVGTTAKGYVEQRTGVQVPTSAGSAAATAQSYVEQQTGVKVPPLSAKGAVGVAKQLGAQEAEKLKADLFAEAGLPNIPLRLPPKPTVESVSNTVYQSTKPIVEKRIQEYTGYPIKLPNKLSAKALANTVKESIPTNIEDAVDLGLAFGTQAAAGALTAALVGAGVGSVIPGLGTIVGIATALAVAALKGVVKDALTEKRGQECKTSVGCPQAIPNHLSPIELLPWMTPYYVAAWQAQARTCGFPQKIVDRYVKGPAPECRDRLNTIALKVFELGIAKTPFDMGLFQLAKFIPQYEQALAQWDRIGQQKGFRTGGQDTMRLVLDRMLARRDALLKLGARTNAALKSGNRSELSAVRFAVIEELKKAALQAELAPGPDTLNWYKGVSQYANAIHAADINAQKLMHQRAAEARARGEKRLREDPKAREQLRKQQEAFKRSEQQQRAPTRMTPAQAKSHCNNLLTTWSRDPRQAQFVKCLTQADREAILDICVNAFAHGTMTPATALQMIQRQIQVACARK